ncbi:hypothetical protein CJF32_00011243 [Rutstroemia sp. NJR-2017a WRK4]|nr:hypothetical protein CJF32_00011243 [Rutstroemia sp. NJR-2017a WRK4]
MSATKKDEDFQIWIIDPCDHERIIEFKGKSISIFNRDTNHTAEDHVNISTVTQYTIKAGYECILHGFGKGSFAELSDKT